MCGVSVRAYISQYNTSCLFLASLNESSITSFVGTIFHVGKAELSFIKMPSTSGWVFDSLDIYRHQNTQKEINNESSI